MSKIDKPWGHEEILSANSKYIIKRIFIRAGLRLSLQYHEKKEETMLIKEGTGLIVLGENKSAFNIASGDMLKQIDIPAGTKHRVKALTDTVIYEISTPELDDVVRLEDDYGRVK